MSTSDPQFLITAGNFFFRFRNALFPLVVVFVCLLLRPTVPFYSVELDRLTDLLGILVLLSGQGLRAAVIGYAYIRRGGVNKQVYADDLVTSGFFALSRNPLYVGNLLIYAGLLIVHNNPWSYLIGGGFFLFAYRAIVAAEENYLRAKFGAAFDEYCSRTPRWLPNVFRMEAALKDMTFSWRRVIAKDYSTACASLLTLLLVLAHQQLYLSGWQGAREQWKLLGVIAAVVVFLTLLARYAKKTGRLRS